MFTKHFKSVVILQNDAWYGNSQNRKSTSSKNMFNNIYAQWLICGCMYAYTSGLHIHSQIIHPSLSSGPNTRHNKQVHEPLPKQLTGVTIKTNESIQAMAGENVIQLYIFSATPKSLVNTKRSVKNSSIKMPKPYQRIS